MTNNANEALEPCPFCGGEATLHKTRSTASIRCSDRLCLTRRVPISSIRDAAAMVAAWNRRILASDTAPRIISWGSSLSQGFSEASDTISNGGGEASQSERDKEFIALINEMIAVVIEMGGDPLKALGDAAKRALARRDAHPPAAEPVELREALEPFARLARPINGEEGRPTYLEAISGPYGTDELQLSTYVGDGTRFEILDAEDFRRANRVLAALATPARTDDAAPAGVDVAAMREADTMNCLMYGCIGRAPLGRSYCPKHTALPLPSQEVEPAAEGGVMTMDRELYARIAPDLCAMIYGKDLDSSAEMKAIVRHRLSTQAAYPTGAGEIDVEQTARDAFAKMKTENVFYGPLTGSDMFVAARYGVTAAIAALTPADARKGEVK